MTTPTTVGIVIGMTTSRTHRPTRSELTYIRRARVHGIILTAADFGRVNGESTLDGMDPNEWIDAMIDD